MKLGIVLRTAGIFFAVASATFVATDPAALPDWAKAAIGAAIAGLAAIGITPPGSAPLTVLQNVNRLSEQTQTVTKNLAERVSTVETDHDDLYRAHEEAIDAIELHLNSIRSQLASMATADHAPVPPPLSAVPAPPEPPESPAPEVPS